MEFRHDAVLNNDTECYLARRSLFRFENTLISILDV